MIIHVSKCCKISHFEGNIATRRINEKMHISATHFRFRSSTVFPTLKETLGTCRMIEWMNEWMITFTINNDNKIIFQSFSFGSATDLSLCLEEKTFLVLFLRKFQLHHSVECICWFILNKLGRIVLCCWDGFFFAMSYQTFHHQNLIRSTPSGRLVTNLYFANFTHLKSSFFN